MLALFFLLHFNSSFFSRMLAHSKNKKANLPSADTVAKKAEVAAELARLAVAMEEIFEGNKNSLQVLMGKMIKLFFCGEPK